MAFPLMAIPAGISALSGLYEALQGGKPSPEEEEMLTYFRNRMKYGIGGDERMRIRDQYAPAISRGHTERQNRLANAFASRGTGYSTSADIALAQIPSIGESLGQIESQFDTAARQEGASVYPQLQRMVKGQRTQAIQSGLSTMGTGIMQGVGAFEPKPEDPTEKYFRLYKKYFPDEQLDFGAPFEGVGTPYEPQFGWA